MVQNFKNLKIWKRSFLLTIKVYKITKNYPKYELHSLTSQIRRSASSVPSNIAEGASRNTKKDFTRFLNQAYSSLKELENHLLLSKELKYLKIKDFSFLEREIDETSRMIFKLINKIKQEY